MKFKKINNQLVIIFLIISNMLFADNYCSEVQIENIKNDAIKGNPLKQLTMGILYQNGICVDKNISTAIKWLEMSSDAGYPPSNYVLGDMYYFGQNTKIDYQKSEIFYKKILLDSNSVILQSMGYIYTQYGKKTNWLKAERFYLLAAERDHPIALFSLGLMYGSGLGIDKNITKSIKYFEKVITNKSILNTVLPNTMYYLARVLNEKNQKLYKNRIIDLIKTSASKGYADAQVLLGEGYLLGEDVEKNLTKAIYWIKKAKDQNSTEAIEVWNKYELDRSLGVYHSLSKR